jgi:hypothetical protein
MLFVQHQFTKKNIETGDDQLHDIERGLHLDRMKVITDTTTFVT